MNRSTILLVGSLVKCTIAHPYCNFMKNQDVPDQKYPSFSPENPPCVKILKLSDVWLLSDGYGQTNRQSGLFTIPSPFLKLEKC